MARVTTSKKACAVNPLKMSQPLGAALAFLGLDRSLPLFHGAQGCTSFGLVLLVRHFRETIPLQTTAMSEVTTILGGMDNIEAALLNIHKRAEPDFIGLISTGLTETKGDDVGLFLKLIGEKHPQLADTSVVFVSTPDYSGSFQDGWGKAVTAVVAALAQSSGEPIADQVNVLAGCHLTPGDIEEIREMVEAFGLVPVILPDLSGSLDGHVPETFLPHTLGGTPRADVRQMGRSVATLAIGEHMRGAAAALDSKAGVPYRLFERLTGLEACDQFLVALSEIARRPIPGKYRRQRSQLQDAMLDGHFYFGGRKVAIGAEPDLLFALGSFLTEMGCDLAAAVATTDSPVLARLFTEEVLIGDLEDLEARAAGCDLLVTHSHGRQMARRLGLPFHRAGIPTFDRLGAAQQVSVGYRGTRNLIFDIGNQLIEAMGEHTPDDWRLPETSHADAPTAAGE